MNNWITLNWRELLVRFALVFFGLALWPSGLVYWGIGLLVIAWLADGGLSRFPNLLKEPLVLGILVFCGVWVIGLLWSDFSVASQGKWKKYFILLTFIPFFSLLNKRRLPWAIGALISGYLGVVIAGGYQWIIQGLQGAPLFGMSYLSYSAVLGIGVILAVSGGWVVLARESRFLAVLLWLVAILLLFLQLNQSARGLLLATLVTLLLILVQRYWSKRKILLSGLISIVAIATLFAINSDIFQERLQQGNADLQLFQQGDYRTSVGYRLAIWDIGLHGIAERPLLGHGSGMARQYLQDSFITYKEGIYRGLTGFDEARHFHSELIEIGVNLGLLGVSAYILLLWLWFSVFRRHQMALLGSAIVCFTFLSGLTDTFLLYSRVPPFLLAVTAVIVCWQRYEGSLGLLGGRKSLQIEDRIQDS